MWPRAAELVLASVPERAFFHKILGPRPQDWIRHSNRQGDMNATTTPQEFDFKAGDVILTTRTGALPALLRALVGAPVSHAAVMITPEFAIEARDDAWDLSESGGRVYIRSKDELFESDEVERVVVRRPPTVDDDQLVAFAVDIVEREPRFANAALAMAALYKLRARIRRLALALSRRLSDEGEALDDDARWIEAIADGTKTVVCTEVVYRALGASGSTICLERAYMASAMPLLPDTPAAQTPRCAHSTRRRFKHLATMRAPEPETPDLGGRSGSGLAARSTANFGKRVSARLAEEPNGDRADLITPADLYQLDPLVTVAEWARSGDGAWSPAESSLITRRSQVQILPPPLTSRPGSSTTSGPFPFCSGQPRRPRCSSREGGATSL